jgi:tetratricopeptide (TPR) repeat protein
MMSFGEVLDKTRRYASNSSRDLAWPVEENCACPFVPSARSSSRQVSASGPIGLALGVRAEHRCERLIGCVAVGLLLILSGSTSTLAALDDDLKLLLPPISADHSPRVAPIRQAFRSRDTVFMQKKIDELISEEPASFEGYFWQGFLELQKRNNYDAVRFLRRAEVLDANPYVLKLLAFSYYFLDQFQLFTLTMKEALRKQPSDSAPHYYLGRYYASTDAPDFAQAAGHFQQALKLDPNHYPSHYYLGYCHEAERRLKDAEAEYLRSLELAEAASEKFALPCLGLARLRLLEGRPTEAVALGKQAVQLAPDDAASHVVLAKAYAALGRTAQEALEWEQAAALDLRDPVAYYHLYRSYSTLGEKTKADQALGKYKRLIAIYGTR